LPKGVAILLIHLYDLYNIFFHGLNEHMCLLSKAIPSNITSHCFLKDPIVLDKTKLSFNEARSCLKFVSTSCYTYTILMAITNSKSRNQCCSSQENWDVASQHFALIIFYILFPQRKRNQFHFPCMHIFNKHPCQLKYPHEMHTI